MNYTTEQRLDSIETNINILLTRIEQLTIAINTLNETCGRMDSHIDLVENVYSVVRSPLNYITDQYNYVMGNDDNRILPEIESNDNMIMYEDV